MTELVDRHKEVNDASFNWDNLNLNSVVVELGGYQGRWSKEIGRRYNPKLYVFEPQKWAYINCVEALQEYRAQVFNFGLGMKDEELPMGRWGTDGCSFIDKNGKGGIGLVKNARSVLFEALGLNHIDLMLMNIEGFEFSLIPYLFDSGVMIEVEVFMVQFHLSFDYQNVYGKCLELLSGHYTPIWDFGSTLSAWQRK